MRLFAEDLAIPERIRVSIIERLVASVSFGLAALSGIVGGAMTINMFLALSKAENAGIDAIVGALTEMNYAVLGLLGLSITVGIVGVVICSVRMLSDGQSLPCPGFFIWQRESRA